MDLVWYILSALFFFILVILIKNQPLRPRNFPPGPTPVPFFGNILSIGKRLPDKLLEWKEQFGDTYSIFDGQNALVILNNWNTVRTVFADDAATGREQDCLIRTTPGHDVLPRTAGLAFSDGDLWKTHRRFALSTLRDLGMGKSWLEETIIAEVSAVCQILRDTHVEPFNPKVQLSNSISNVICALIFGKRFELTDPKFSQLTSSMAEHVEGAPIDKLLQAFPCLLWFPNPLRTRLQHLRRNAGRIADFLKEQIRNHKHGDRIKSTTAPDYLYAYQREAEKGGNDSFNDKQLLVSLFDLLLAGTETTATTVLWALVFVLENPDVLRAVHEEIDTKVGRDQMLTNAHRGVLPYTEATILEVQRCASMLPLAVPHKARVDMTVEGFTIPKGTFIAANLFAIHRDPRWWNNPEKFDPVRFLDADGKLIRPEAFAPFSTGKRACPGESMAKRELFLFLANLFRCFNFKLAPGANITHKDYTCSVTLCPKPFELIFVPRFGA